MISIRPKWCELITSGEKTIEIRKNHPRLAAPFKCYIYATQDKWEHLIQNPDKTYEIYNGKDYGKYDRSLKFAHERNGKVIGEFTCDHIGYVRNYGDCVDWYDVKASCLTAREIIDYAKDKGGNFMHTFGWHISDLKIYDEPKELSAFGLKKPPQSWCYVEELKQ